MGSDSELVQLREQVRTQPEYDKEFGGQDIPRNKVAAIAAGLVYNDNITKFRHVCKYMDKI